jgi:hypothetical protein
MGFSIFETNKLTLIPAYLPRLYDIYGCHACSGGTGGTGYGLGTNGVAGSPGKTVIVVV